MLGEHFTPYTIFGGAIVVVGIAMAIVYGSTREPHDTLKSPIVVVVALGLLSATAQAIGLIAMKPVLDAGADPLAASAIRTGLAAIAITILALWPATFTEPVTKRTPALVGSTIVSGVLGYVVAVTLLLAALKSGNTGLAAIVGSLSPVLMLPIIWRMSRRPPWQAWFGAGFVVFGIMTMFSNS
jgi:drug/metabolite transporter (DMT)-like permease